MDALSFYLVYPIVYLIASLPFRGLYIFSNIFYYLLKVTGYRRKIVLKNLRNSFPEKTESEVKLICNNYYRYLCDLIVETFKTLKMTEKENLQHCTFHKKDWLDKFYDEKKSIIIVMGHYGNWEWAGPCFTLNSRYQLVVIYRPLAHLYFEKMLVGMRTKFGTRITPVEKTLRDMVANRGQMTATAFIADQTATKKNAYWTKFLNQDTAVFTGPEKLAKKFNYPVVFMDVQRVKRGHYEITPELLFSNPVETADDEISETFTRRMEQAIIKDPSIWLWSHKRWKHTRPK